ncbi:MAG TPA: methionyl-tRNA formyltransferase [Burkholderiales bacterium]|nr:methionyl-tRNA formyltransferase [Burkholderiales bacterium]
MRLVFAGTPAFAEAALEALLAVGHDIALVLTQPDRPAGRGLQARSSEVKALAQARGLEVMQPATLKSQEVVERLRAAGAATMVVAAYGLILPPIVLDLFPAGCINIHASLLPRWRGAAPIQRAILAGDAETGISIMQMEPGLDSGPVYLAERVSIMPADTAGSLHDRLAGIGGRCIVRALAELEAGQLVAVPQPAVGVTYARKIEKSEALIDWRLDAVSIDRQVRAFNPVPVANTTWRGEPLRIWSARVEEHPRPEPGRIMEVSAQSVIVGCGHGALALRELQRAGGKRLPAADFLRGSWMDPGEMLGT